VSVSDLMQAMAAAGAPMEAIILAVRAIEAKDAEIAARDQAAAEKRAEHAEWKRNNRASKKVSMDSQQTNRGRPVDTHPDLPPNEYISNPPSEPSEAKASGIPFSEKVVSVWNDMATGTPLSQARKLNTDRRKHLTARVREHGEAAVLDAIRAVGASDWHSGRAGSWKADLGWLLKSPENFQKMLERASPANDTHAKPMTDADRAAYLAKLNSSPMFAATRNAPAPPPRTGNTGPPRSIGELIPHAGAH